jgi:hypothetical protein
VPAGCGQKVVRCDTCFAETVSFSTTFPTKGDESGDSNQSYIHCDGSVGLNPADFTTDPTDSTKI